MPESVKTLEGYSHSYQSICVIGAAAELDLFTPLIRSSLTAPALAGQREIDLRATRTLLDSLVALDILEKSGDAEPVYSVRAGFREQLDIDHPKTFVPMLRHRMNCIRQWVELARVVKSGRPYESNDSLLGAEEDYRSFRAGHEFGRHHIRRRCGRFAGTGRLSRIQTPARRRRGVRNLHARNAQAETAGPGDDFRPTRGDCRGPQAFRRNRIRIPRPARAGRFLRGTNCPTVAIFAWVSAIIHQFDREHARALYAKIYKALEPGGMIAVRDFVMQPDRTAPFDGTMFAINMLTATENGMCYTFDEIRGDLEQSGFSAVKYAVPADTMGAVVTAVK